MRTIGIDFGTTKTLVSRIRTSTGLPETVRLGQGTDHISTAVFIDDDGTLYFGDDADDRLSDPTGTYLRGFKMKLGNSTPVHMRMDASGKLVKYSASDIVTHYLRYIRERVQETVFAGAPVTHATITRPVNFSPLRCEALCQAALDAGFEAVELITEPEAAGLAFCRLCDEEAFLHSAMIVDWGGGTLDFALVTRQENRIETHPHLTDGEKNIGGECFDLQLWNYAEMLLKKQNVQGMDHVSMMPLIRKCKEKLSAATETTLRLRTEDGICPPLTIDRKTFNLLIDSHVELAAGKILRLTERIPAADKPEKLLLVGGSCRIPYIKTKLEAICELPAIAWHLSREAVALGAALWPTNPPGRPKKPIAPELPEPKTELTQEPTPAPIADTIPTPAQPAPQPPTKTHKRRNTALTIAAAGLMLAGIGIPTCLYEPDEHAEEPAEPETATESAPPPQISEPVVTPAEPTEEKDLPKAASDTTVDEQEVDLLILPPEPERTPQEELALQGITSADYNLKLFEAAEIGDKDLTELLILAGADVNSENSKKETPLFKAAENGKADIVKLLIEAKATIDKGNSYGETPLFAAARNKHVDVVELLISAGADVNKTSKNGTTPLYYSCSNGDLATLEVLRNAGASVHYGSADLMWEPCYHGHTDIIRELVEMNADVNRRTPFDSYPIHLCCYSGDIETVKLLIKGRANVNALNKDGKTPLRIATEKGHTEIAELLKASGAVMNAKDVVNLTHIVQAGESISSIALKCGTTTYGILELNEKYKNNANYLKIGDKLLIPYSPKAETYIKKKIQKK